MISVTFPPVKCATGLRYIPLCSRSPISLVFRPQTRKPKMQTTETKENKGYGSARVGTKSHTESPTGSSRKVLMMVNARPHGGFRMVGDYAEIYLSGGRVALIDSVDLVMCSGYRWQEKPNGSGRIYASTKIKRKTVMLHRLVMNAAPGDIVDHRDGNPLDCRRQNLRLASASQNMMNAKARSAGYKGVTASRGNRWRVDIKASGKRIRLNGFKSAEMAARAYDELAIAHHGEFARLNFPAEVPRDVRAMFTGE